MDAGDLLEHVRASAGDKVLETHRLAARRILRRYPSNTEMA